MIHRFSTVYLPLEGVHTGSIAYDGATGHGLARPEVCHATGSCQPTRKSRPTRILAIRVEKSIRPQSVSSTQVSGRPAKILLGSPAAAIVAALRFDVGPASMEFRRRSSHSVQSTHFHTFLGNVLQDHLGRVARSRRQLVPVGHCCVY